MYTIQTTKREEKEKAETLRTKGFVPAVFYGYKRQATSIAVKAIDFKKIWKEAGESSQVTLETDEGKVETMIHEVQFDPVTGTPIHIDFLAIDTNKAVTVDVPLEYEGISEAVKGGLGNLVKVLHEISVSALPKDLPHSLTISISSLNAVGDQVHVKDISIPAGVTIMTDGDEVVALIAAQVEEKEEEVPVDLSAIEVEKKGKKEEADVPVAEAPVPEK